jgi:hypothetical protein
MRDTKFEPKIYFINGEYLAHRLTNNGNSKTPSLSKVPENAIGKIYNIDKDDPSEVMVFAGYTMEPCNDPKAYERAIDYGYGLKNFNLYELPIHQKGHHYVDEQEMCNWQNIANLIMHIAPHQKPFPGSRYTYLDLLLDYLASAWNHPKQRLPIVVLVSKERSTGKTTFLNLLGLMFQSNARTATIGEINSDFNYDWGLGNIVLIDEANIPKKLIGKIRDEATRRNRNINAKNKPPFAVPNYTKFVMATNDVDDFAEIDEEENRYFVIEVKPFLNTNEKTDFMALMKKELPHFLNYLEQYHQLATKSESRTWFNYQYYRTPALERVTQKSKSKVALKVEEALEILYSSISLDLGNDYIWNFSLTNFRKTIKLDKGAEDEIKRELIKLGDQSSSNRIRFECAYSDWKQVNAIKYSISVGQLEQIFNPSEVKKNKPVPIG